MKPMRDRPEAGGSRSAERSSCHRARGRWRRDNGSARRRTARAGRERASCISRSRRSASASARRCPCRIRDCRPNARLEADQVHRVDRRLVEKIGRGQRRGADQVAGRDGDRVRGGPRAARPAPPRDAPRRRSRSCACAVRARSPRPASGASRLPWKSLKARIWTSIGGRRGRAAARTVRGAGGKRTAPQRGDELADHQRAAPPGAAAARRRSR